MKQSTHRMSVTSACFALALGFGTVSLADSGSYEIIKSSEDRLWRLNRHTGEIAVCSLEGEQLLCTNSTQAIVPPAMSYAELQAEREQQAEREALRRLQREERRQAVLNAMFGAFRAIAMPRSDSQ